MDDFTTTYHPDSYQFLSISSENDNNTVIKLFVVWNSGYLSASSWRINSGVTKIEKDTTFDNLYIVSGYSGSQYIVNKDSTKLSSYGEGVLRDITEKAANQGIIVQRISLEETIREVGVIKMKQIRALSENEVEALQLRIVNEHWVHTDESFGIHIYQTWWDIDGVKYTLCQALRDDVLPLGWELG